MAPPPGRNATRAPRLLESVMVPMPSEGLVVWSLRLKASETLKPTGPWPPTASAACTAAPR